MWNQIMASVNFEKLKTPQQVKAMLRHCDGEERMEANHSNIDIDKSKTSGNMQGDLDYNVINLIKNCVYNQQNILKNSVFLKKFCFFL